MKTLKFKIIPNRNTKIQDKKALLNAVFTAACSVLGSDGWEMFTRGKQDDMVRFRHYVFYLCRENTGIGPSEIAGHFNHDHCMVIWAHKKIRNYLEYDKDTQDNIFEIQRHLLGSLDPLNYKIHSEKKYLALSPEYSYVVGENKQKCAIFVGYTADEIRDIKGLFHNEATEPALYARPSVYILEK